VACNLSAAPLQTAKEEEETCRKRRKRRHERNIIFGESGAMKAAGGISSLLMGVGSDIYVRNGMAASAAYRRRRARHLVLPQSKKNRLAIFSNIGNE